MFVRRRLGGGSGAAGGALAVDPRQPAVARRFDRLSGRADVALFGREELVHAEQHRVVLLLPLDQEADPLMVMNARSCGCRMDAYELVDASL
jgi:hypothetical protein